MYVTVSLCVCVYVCVVCARWTKNQRLNKIFSNLTQNANTRHNNARSQFEKDVSLGSTQLNSTTFTVYIYLCIIREPMYPIRFCLAHTFHSTHCVLRIEQFSYKACARIEQRYSVQMKTKEKWKQAGKQARDPNVNTIFHLPSEFIFCRGVVYLPFVIGCSFSYPPTVRTKAPSCAWFCWRKKKLSKRKSR